MEAWKNNDRDQRLQWAITLIHLAFYSCSIFNVLVQGALRAVRSNDGGWVRLGSKTMAHLVDCLFVFKKPESRIGHNRYRTPFAISTFQMPHPFLGVEHTYITCPKGFFLGTSEVAQTTKNSVESYPQTSFEMGFYWIEKHVPTFWSLPAVIHIKLLIHLYNGRLVDRGLLPTWPQGV